MSDTLSSFELATISVPSCRYSAVGSRPTGMLAVCLPAARSTTDTVPVVAAPVVLSATIGVPSERLVKSPDCAGRPPSSDTNAWLPTITTCRGALPTGIWLTRVLVAVLMTPSVLAPFKATYAVEPSGEKAIPDGSAAPPGALGIWMVATGAGFTVPSGLTANLSRSTDCGTHSDLPSGE